jgi:lipopolysaccharide export system permease protein
MLFHSSLRKELARSFGATLVILITIVMTIMLIRTLGLATRGSVNPSDVMLVMGYTVLGHLPTILSLSLFIAIVATLSRMYRDSEVVIWFSSGRGLAGFIGPLFRFAWPVLVVIALMALVVWPWANRQSQDLRDRYERRGDIDRIAPGQFQESSSGNRVFFIDKDTVDGSTGSNVFISSTDRNKQAVTSARSGRIDTVGDQRFLVLRSGQRLESTQGAPELKISEFEEYGTQIGANALDPQDVLPAKSRNTLALIREPVRPYLGELAWRLGLALGAINFVVLAIAVTSVNPRVGRSGNLVFALFAFIVYYNMLNLGQSWIATGRVGFGAFLLGLHGGVFALCLAWLTLRHNNWSWRSLLRPRREVTP